MRQRRCRRAVEPDRRISPLKRPRDIERKHPAGRQIEHHQPGRRLRQVREPPLPNARTPQQFPRRVPPVHNTFNPRTNRLGLEDFLLLKLEIHCVQFGVVVCGRTGTVPVHQRVILIVQNRFDDHPDRGVVCPLEYPVIVVVDLAVEDQTGRGENRRERWRYADWCLPRERHDPELLAHLRGRIKALHIDFLRGVSRSHHPHEPLKHGVAGGLCDTIGRGPGVIPEPHEVADAERVLMLWPRRLERQLRGMRVADRQAERMQLVCGQAHIRERTTRSRLNLHPQRHSAPLP